MDRTWLAVVASVLALGAACGSDSGDGAVSSGPTSTTECSGPDCPVSSSVDPSAPAEPGGPEIVEPIGNAVDVRPSAWDELVPAEELVPADGEVADGDDTRFFVTFWSGVAPCHVVDRVEVAETEDRVTISLYTGAAPDAGDTACIELAVHKAVLVELDAPLGDRSVVDGAEAED